MDYRHPGPPVVLNSFAVYGGVCLQKLCTCKLSWFSTDCHLGCSKLKFDFKAYKTINICLKKYLHWVTVIQLKPSIFFFSPMKFLYIGNRAEHQPEVKRLSVITAQEQRDHHEHLSQFSCLSCTLNWLRFIFKVLPCFKIPYFYFLSLYLSIHPKKTLFFPPIFQLHMLLLKIHSQASCTISLPWPDLVHCK